MGSSETRPPRRGRQRPEPRRAPARGTPSELGSALSGGQSGRVDPLLGVLRDLFSRLRPRGLGAGRVLVLVLAVIFGGAWLFMRTEHVSYFKAIYWAVTTASTVGYGDVVPTNVAARVVAMGMMVLAVPLLGLALASIASVLVEGRLRSVLGMAGHSFPDGFTLVLQWSASAQVAVRDLLRRGHSVVVVSDVDRLGVEDPHLHFVHGDPVDEDLLTSLRPEGARAALLCHAHDGDLLVAAIALHRIAPGLPLMAVPARASTAHALRELGIAVSFPSAEFMGYVLARGSESPHAGELLWQLVADDAYAVRERPVAREEVGGTVEAARARRAASGEIVLGVFDRGRVSFTLAGKALDAGDRLLVLVAQQNVGR